MTTRLCVALFLVLFTMLGACVPNTVPLSPANRSSLENEPNLLVYKESEKLSGISVGGFVRGRSGLAYRGYGNVGLVHAPRVRERTMERIRDLTGWSNFILHDAPLIRDMSDVDPLSQEAQHRSAYNGIYLVFRSQWRVIDHDPRTMADNGFVYTAQGANGLHFMAEGLLIRPTDIDDEILWRGNCHIATTDNLFARASNESRKDSVRRLNTDPDKIQEKGQQLAEFCAEHLARSFAGQPPQPRPPRTRVLSDETGAIQQYYWTRGL